VIVEKDRQLGQMKKAQESTSSGWLNNVTISGAVELETSYNSPYTGDSTSDATVATAEIGIEAQVHDWVSAQITLLHEEDDTSLEVVSASFTIGPPEGNWSLTAGQIVVPFGAYESNMISDPLTLEVGEAKETAIQLSFNNGGFSGSVYAFNGANKDGGDNHIDNFGASIGYAMESENNSFAFGLGYINDIGDSDNLQSTVSTTLGSANISDHVGGWAANASVTFGPFALIGEYLSAFDNFEANEVVFNGRGAEPSAWHVEAAYNFNVGGKDATFAVSYQGTDEALALEQPEQRIMVGLSVGLFENVGLAFEWAHDEDYSVADGGTGNTANTVTGQIAVGF
tara:strand:- start:3006 stop:4028 length:1023 start_codon:yes stop_codon:yes gene_type:complete